MYENIEKHVSRITNMWYEKKLSEFIKPAKGYDSNTGKRIIKTAGFNSVLDEKTGKIYSEIAWEETEEISIEEFCWCDEERYQQRGEFYPGEELDPFDAYSVLHDICENIDELIPDNDVEVSFNIINSASKIFSEILEKKEFEAKSNPQFVKVCRFISERGVMIIRKRFEKVVQQYIYGKESIIKLDFELNKQQLAALIFLIDEAGMLTEKKRGAFGKYDFFEKHFNWTDHSDLSKNQLTGLKKNISEFKNGVRTNSVTEVFEMLKKANNNFARPKW
jgi:hypothetical protein